MGTFVSISENKVALDDMSDQIDLTIAYTRAYADEMRVTLTTALENMYGLVGTYNPDITDVDTSIDPIDRPVFPAKPLLPDYESTCILDNLISKICKGITEGGSGLTEIVYNAIIAKEQSTRLTNQDRVYRAALDGVGSLGFKLPSGQVAAMQTELAEDRIALDQAANHDLNIKDFDLATENTRFMITSGIELEKMLQAAWDSAAGRIVDMYEAETKGIADQYNALTSWVEAEVERIKMEATVAIENGKLGLDAYNASTKLASDVAEAIANIASQSIASALGAINTSLSNSYSGSENRGENWGHSESLSESHAFDEE